jgi:hypothetical protein
MLIVQEARFLKNGLVYENLALDSSRKSDKICNAVDYVLCSARNCAGILKGYQLRVIYICQFSD